MTRFGFGKFDEEQVSNSETDPPKFNFASNVPTSEPPKTESIKFGVYGPTFGATAASNTFCATNASKLDPTQVSNFGQQTSEPTKTSIQPPKFGVSTTTPSTFGAAITSPHTFESTSSIKFGSFQPPKFGANITEPIKFRAEPNRSVFEGVSTSEASKRVFGAIEAPKFGFKVFKPLFGSEAKEGQPKSVFSFGSGTSKPNFNFGAKPEDKSTFKFGVKTDAPTFNSFNTTATTTAITTPTVMLTSKTRRLRYDFNFSYKRSQERRAQGGISFGEPPTEEDTSNLILYRPGEGPNPNPPPAPPFPPVPKFDVPYTFISHFINNLTFEAPAQPFGQSRPSSPQAPFAFGQTTAPSFNFYSQNQSQSESGIFQFRASTQNQNTTRTPLSFNAPGAGGQIINIRSGNTSS